MPGENVVLGFLESGVKRIISGEKTSTDRLGVEFAGLLAVGDTVTLRDSTHKRVFGYAAIACVEVVPFSDLPVHLPSGSDTEAVAIERERMRSALSGIYEQAITDDDIFTVIDFNPIAFCVDYRPK